MRDRLHFAFINAGHFLDHLFMLVYATAVLALAHEWKLGYAELVPYATPGFIAFGLFSLPAGWLADRWNRYGMIAVFFIGSGIASIATAWARSPLEIGIWLFVLGVFAAIYHPVGLALVVQGRAKPGMAIAVNGVFGNLGVASAALLTGYFIDNGGWRTAFIVPGIVSIVLGIGYAALMWPEIVKPRPPAKPVEAGAAKATAHGGMARHAFIRLTAVIFFTTAISSLVFQSTTFALPKVFEERLGGIAGSATMIGQIAFVVFAVASLAQLVVGRLLDVVGPRATFLGAAAIQLVFFTLMPGLNNWAALAVALGFMLGAFGQIPINDYMIGRMAKSEWRASVYGIRYVVSFAVLAATIPLIAYTHKTYGFDTLFRLLAVVALAIFCASLLLPRQVPAGDEVAAPAPAR